MSRIDPQVKRLIQSFSRIVKLREKDNILIMEQIAKISRYLSMKPQKPYQCRLCPDKYFHRGRFGGHVKKCRRLFQKRFGSQELQKRMDVGKVYEHQPNSEPVKIQEQKPYNPNAFIDQVLNSD